MNTANAFFDSNFPDEISGQLLHPAAAAMAKLLGSGAYAGATLRACRRPQGRANRELLIVDVEVALGQRAIENDIRSVEPIALVYGQRDVLPGAYPLRKDFPTDIPHFNLAGRGLPRSLCLFDMQPEEALRLATPFVFMEQVRFWLHETAYGRLHGEDQPLDPLFFGALTQVILPQGADKGADAYLAFTKGKGGQAPYILVPLTTQLPLNALLISTIMIETEALLHRRLREVPVNVAELIEVYAERGVDIVPLLKTALRAWLQKPNWGDLAGSECLIVVQTPLERAPGKIEGMWAKAFFTKFKAIELAEQLGAFHKEGGYGSILIVQEPHDMDGLRQLEVDPLDVCRSFDRPTALAASGIAGQPGDPVRILLAGAGAIGSQVALTAARMGLGSWHIVDADYLLPHNMARHALSHMYVGGSKSEMLALEVCGLLGQEAASFEIARIEDVTTNAISAAGIVIDATASVPAARWLAVSSKHLGRTCSVFLNPAGTDLVMLLEGENRIPRLDQIEMTYYWALASGNGPQSHLSDGKVGLFPSGGCRRASLAISQADVGSLSPLAVKRILQHPLPNHGLVEIITVRSGTMETFSCQAVECSEVNLDGWTVVVSREVLDGMVADRKAASPLETGGILVGSWDRVRRIVYVVGRYAPPPDSVSGPLSFIRGADGVYQTLETVERLTARNLTYIGEWHTHPPGFGSQPSDDDRKLLRWIGDVLVFSDVPSLILVAGDDGVRVVMGGAASTCLVPDGKQEGSTSDNGSHPS